MYMGNRRAADREYPPHIIRIDGKPVCVKRLRCASDGCGFEAEVIDRTRTGMAPDVVEKNFKRKGWEVGVNEKHDFCPACVEQRRLERRARRAPQATALKLVSTQGESMPQVAVTVDAPRKMGFDDRRIILAKLQDVYLNETSGYQSPWTDAKVATDLGVPQAWVEELREQNFGPAADNQEIRAMLDRVEINAKEAKNLLHEAKAVRAEGAALVERINSLNARAVDIGKNLDGLLTLADRIKAAVA
jgi:hypothetical protein